MSAARPHIDEIARTGTASADLLHLLRERVPLVQCITNQVVAGFTANVLLALGAAPAMTDVPTEAGPFARIASGVLLNLGTPHAEQREAAVEANAAITAPSAQPPPVTFVRSASPVCTRTRRVPSVMWSTGPETATTVP